MSLILCLFLQGSRVKPPRQTGYGGPIEARVVHARKPALMGAMGPASMDHGEGKPTGGVSAVDLGDMNG